MKETLMLFQPSELGGAELTVVREIEELKKTLQWRLREPQRWYGSLRRMAFARAIQGSNTIEGFDAALDDAAAVGAGEPAFDIDNETYMALSGYCSSMTYVLQIADESTLTYSEQLLKALHFMMTSYELKNRPGKWRSGAIAVRSDKTGEVVHEGPPVDDVPGLIGELMTELNRQSALSPFIRAAMAHLNLVMIHPFRDGNGRMARCLQTLVLAREGLLDPVFVSIEEYLGENTQSYYEVLGEVGGGSWQPERDTQPWIRYILTAHLRQARAVVRRSKETELLWDALETRVHELGLADRVVVALFDAAMGFRVRNGTYRATFDDSPEEISDQTASRDFQRLVKSKLLISQGESRGRYYLASRELSGIFKEIKSDDPRDDSDPFANAV